MGKTLAILALVLISTQVCAQNFPLIPDPDLTPGEIASTDKNEVCGIVDGQSYSKRHRVTPHELKVAVAVAYGLSLSDLHFVEIDHRGPLAMGFADTAKNPWPQVWGGACGAVAKDKLEEEIWRAVCKAHTMTLEQGQAIFMGPFWRQLPGCVTPE